MIIKPMITWVPSAFSGYIWLTNTKNVLTKNPDELKVVNRNWVNELSFKKIHK